MLNLIEKSSNRKTGNCAQSYRAGPGNMLSTCPTECKLNPSPKDGASEVDYDYLDALLRAVPKDGISFTYTHFPVAKWFKQFKARLSTGKPTTVINYSSDTIEGASIANKQVPTVVALPVEKVKHDKTWNENDTRFVVCPATYNDKVTCEGCGGGVPLCARPTRDYVVVFPAHGSARKRVGAEKEGGCYAWGGYTRMTWSKLAKKLQNSTDGEKLLDWVKNLKPGRILRHHIAGDIGAIKQEIV